MENWWPSEYRQRVTHIMRNCAEYHSSKMISGIINVQCSANTAKAVGRDVDRCNGDYEAVASRNEHNLLIISVIGNSSPHPRIGPWTQFKRPSEAAGDSIQTLSGED